MTVRLPRLPILLAIVVGTLLRIGSLVANLDLPHGDVHLDAATAESLAKGRGFWTPWEEGAVWRDDPIGAGRAEWGHPADQHGPLWPLLAAPLVPLAGGRGVLALQLVSLLFGLAAIPAAAALFGKLSPRAGIGAAWACALSLALCDYSGNGSLYSAQVLGVLALPLVAGELDSRARALAAGAVLGLLFLLNYQCAVLIPAFGIAVLAVQGLRSLGSLALAAAACVAVALPWFGRNALVFGDPFYTTNPQYVAYNLRLVSLDLEGSRPSLVSAVEPKHLWYGLQRWFPSNLAYWIATSHLALPVLPLFAPGGLARMLGLRAGEGRSLAGAILLATLLALLLVSAAWPSPKARYVVPIVAILAGAAMAELTEGARFLPAAAMAATTALLGWSLGAGTSLGFPWAEGRYLLPTLLLPFAALSATLRTALPAIALLLVTLFGAFRVWLGLDRVAAARFLAGDPTQAQLFGAPTATFYDVIGGPTTESFNKSELFDLKRCAQRLSDVGTQRVLGPVELYALWKGAIVAAPPFLNRFDLGVLPRVQAVYDADGLVLPVGFLTSPELGNDFLQFLMSKRGTMLYGPDDGAHFYAAFRIPPR